MVVLHPTGMEHALPPRAPRMAERPLLPASDAALRSRLCGHPSQVWLHTHWRFWLPVDPPHPTTARPEGGDGWRGGQRAGRRLLTQALTQA